MRLVLKSHTFELVTYNKINETHANEITYIKIKTKTDLQEGELDYE